MLQSMSTLQRKLRDLEAGRLPKGTHLSHGDASLVLRGAREEARELVDQYQQTVEKDQSATDQNHRRTYVQESQVYHLDSRHAMVSENKDHFSDHPEAGQKVLSQQHTIRSNGGRTGLQVNEICKTVITEETVTQFLLCSTTYNTLSGQVFSMDRTGHGRSSFQSFSSARDE